MLFHMMNDVSKVMRFSFHRLRSSTEKSLVGANKKIAKRIDTAINKTITAESSMRLRLLSARQALHQKSLRRLSTALHPFAILSSTKQIHFNGRGLSAKRAIFQTAIHNYYLRRADGTTACERLSGIKPDDMFGFIIKNLGPLSDPRKRKVKTRSR